MLGRTGIENRVRRVAVRSEKGLEEIDRAMLVSVWHLAMVWRRADLHDTEVVLTHGRQISRILLFCGTCRCVNEVLPPLAIQGCRARLSRERLTIAAVPLRQLLGLPSLVLCHPSLLAQTCFPRSIVLSR